MSTNTPAPPDAPRPPSITPETLPVLALRDKVVFPHIAISLFVGRERSVKALNSAMAADRRILLVAQKNPHHDDPGPNDLYTTGTVASIMQLLKLPDGTVKVLVEGIQRAGITDWTDTDGYWAATCAPQARDEGRAPDAATEEMMRAVVSEFEAYVKTLGPKGGVSDDVPASLSGIDTPGRLADTIAGHLTGKLEDAQKALEIADPVARLKFVHKHLTAETEAVQIDRRVKGRVKQQMEKNQREYYLHEQMKAIQKELSEGDETVAGEMEELARRIAKAGMPKAARTRAEHELKKLKTMAPMAAEATVIRNYLDHLLGVPWKARSKVRTDIHAAEERLDADHFGLEKVKERILEHLAVQSRVKNLSGSILCLVGPPGVGKTSLARSIAESLNRKFARMSLGGVRDEAEIRGHRRTYIGAMPGKIIHNLTKAGTKNPLMLLDEIDKMSQDFRGDPASAMLEVLDPEQNRAFQDHYLEVDVDLSEVMFIATANTLNIPGPLLDRMEVIRIPGYTEDEKLAIATRYLLGRALEKNGVKAGELEVTEGAIRQIIRVYTREAGVRNLERELQKIARKAVRQLISAKKPMKKLKVTEKNLSDYLGVERYRYGLAETAEQVGQVTGLAWTEVGGDLLSIEAAVTPGKGNMLVTGSLGNVMQESIKAAHTVVRARAAKLGIDPEFVQKQDIHVHVPDGATPKDGPSAGIAMVTAMVSALTGIPVRADVAMTGEVTLRGEVLPIGGLKEKLLAAQRGGIRTVLIPEANIKDLADVPPANRARLDIRPVKWVDAVLALALARPPGEVAAALEVPLVPPVVLDPGAAPTTH